MGKMEGKLRAKVEAFVRPALQSGEQIVAVLPWSPDRPDAVDPVAGNPERRHGRIRYKAIVVTNSRVIVVRTRSGNRGRREVEESYPKDTVSVTAFEFGAVWGKLVLAIGRESLKLNLGVQYRGGAEQVVQPSAA